MNDETIEQIETFANQPAIDTQSVVFLSDRLSLTAEAAVRLSDELASQGREVPFETCLQVASEQVHSEHLDFALAHLGMVTTATLHSPDFSDNIWAGYYRLSRHIAREQRRQQRRQQPPWTN